MQETTTPACVEFGISIQTQELKGIIDQLEDYECRKSLELVKGLIQTVEQGN